jgi:hypothetical protein
MTFFITDYENNSYKITVLICSKQYNLTDVKLHQVIKGSTFTMVWVHENLKYRQYVYKLNTSLIICDCISKITE